MTQMTKSASACSTNAIEAPSGKGASDENFPVGSFLIAKELRPHVAAYYNFARAGDDIGDDPKLSAEEKIARLTALETALLDPQEAVDGTQKALALHESFAQRSLSLERGRKLLDAFRQDAVKNRYDTWDELIDYCTKSADPVGRFLLDLHDENPAGYHQSDALCTVLQILNHLQDCGKDKAEIDRVYLPGEWLQAQKITVDVLDGDHSPPALRAVLDQCLDGCVPLLHLASALPSKLKSRHLAAESTVIIKLAHKLHHRLQNADPLATRVKLTKLDFIKAGFYGLMCFVFHRTRLDA